MMRQSPEINSTAIQSVLLLSLLSYLLFFMRELEKTLCKGRVELDFSNYKSQKHYFDLFPSTRPYYVLLVLVKRLTGMLQLLRSKVWSVKWGALVPENYIKSGWLGALSRAPPSDRRV